MAFFQTLKKKTEEKTTIEKETPASASPTELPASAIIRKPRITEKSTAGNKRGVYVFDVAPQATKYQTKKEIERLYHVSVVGVQTVTIPAKRRMRGRLAGWKSGHKKAVVRVKEGQTIEISNSPN